MKKINESSLASITGGYSSHSRAPTTVLASVAQVSANPSDTTPSSEECCDSVSHCNQYSHKTITPKNGDRNAKGQIFSWGNWWDDTH
jgi:hypothetical protein